MLDLGNSNRKTRYFAKDQAKAAIATKFIGRGSARSSTHAYANAVGALANCGSYTRDDIVMISAEGARGGRIDPDFTEIQRAINAGATIITDAPADRNRHYNLGERQVAAYLITRGYREIEAGRWMPKA